MEFGLKENQGLSFSGGPSLYLKRVLVSKKRRNRLFGGTILLISSVFLLTFFLLSGGETQPSPSSTNNEVDSSANQLEHRNEANSVEIYSENNQKVKEEISKLKNQIFSLQSDVKNLQNKVNQLEEKKIQIPIPSRRAGDRFERLEGLNNNREFSSESNRLEGLAGRNKQTQGLNINEPLKEKEEKEKEEIPVVVPPHIPQNEQDASLGRADPTKREAIKNAMKHAWKGYEQYAWGYDEVAPIKKHGFNWLGEKGLATTMVDSLDTLLIMNMNDEYKKARDWLVNNLKFDGDGMTSLMEATIRVIGGFLSAYELTGENDEGLLGKAKELGDLFLKNFNTPSGIPYSTMILSEKRPTNPNWSMNESPLSEITTIQLEFLALSYHTKDPIYKEKALRVYDILNDLNVRDGLFSVYVDINTGRTSRSHITLGALGDSFYEYMLKVYLMTGDQKWEKMYQRSAKGIIEKLVHYSKPNQLTFIAELIDGNIHNKMDHLVCFTGGMFAMGAKGEHKEEHMRIASGITETCYQMYARMNTGIAPEIVRFENNENDFHPSPGAYHYILRPETVESLFYMWRLTHDQKYRDQGWKIFQQLEKYLRVENGYSGIRNVQNIPVQYDDEQRSFFLAETLKYLYLLFADDDVIPLDKYVFNTEAHPLLRRDKARS